MLEMSALSGPEQLLGGSSRSSHIFKQSSLDWKRLKNGPITHSGKVFAGKAYGN